MPNNLRKYLSKLTLKKRVKNIEDTIQFPYKKYNLTHKCIGIHIPKNAGTSILNHLEYRGGRHHCSYVYYKKSDITKFNSYYKFSFVRNPFDRLISTYEYLKRGGNQTNDIVFLELFKNDFDNFTSFVLDFLDHHIIHEIRILKPQYLYIYDFEKRLQVDFLGRFENLHDDFTIVCQNINVESTDLKTLNRSERDEYEKYYTNDLVVEKVATLYKKDFEWLGYKPFIS